MKKTLSILAVAVLGLTACGAVQAGQHREPKHQDRDHDRYERNDRDHYRDRDRDHDHDRDRYYDRDHDRYFDRDHDRDRDDCYSYWWNYYGWGDDYGRDRDNHPPIRIRPLQK